MKKMRESLLAKLICMVVIPLVLLGSSLILLGRNGIKSTVSNEVMNQLENSLQDVKNAMDVFDEGDYSVRNQVFFKGKSDIAYMNDYIRTVKENTNIDITIFVQDTRYLTTIKSNNGNLALGTKADSDVIKTVLEKGESYQSDHVLVNGEKFFGVYLPLKDENKQVIGMLFAGSPVSYVNKIVSKEAGTMTIMSVVMIVMILLCSFFITYRIAERLKNTIQYVCFLSEGDFGFQVNDRDCNRRDEIGGLVQGIRNLRDTLKDMVSGIMHSSNSLYTGSEDLKEMNENYVRATDQISKIIEELRQSIVSMAENIQICNGVTEDMGNQIDDIVKDMSELRDTTASAADTTEYSLNMIEILKKTNGTTVKNSENIETHVYKTDECVRSISVATERLSEITSRINLLSLNARIEAAKAGIAGNGFAVVADEIGQLSKQSEKNTNDIIQITKDLLQASERTTGDAKSMRTAVEQEKNALENTEEVFLQMLDNIHIVEKLVKTSMEKTETMRRLKDTVIDNMCDLSTIGEENAAIAENVNDECNKIAEQSDRLTDKSEKIRVLAFELEEKLRFFQGKEEIKNACENETAKALIR